jgi:hypothetical protein
MLLQGAMAAISPGSDYCNSSINQHGVVRVGYYLLIGELLRGFTPPDVRSSSATLPSSTVRHQRSGCV